MRGLPHGVRPIAAALFLAWSAAFGQAILDNATVVKLIKADVGEATVVAMINQQQGSYSLSSDDLVALKKAGASDKIISAMILRNGGHDIAVQPRPSGIPTPSPQAVAPSPSSQEPGGQIRIYVADSQSWEMRGGWRGFTNSNGSGGARPQTAEIIKTFNQRCTELIVTNDVAKAEFAVTLDHEGGKDPLRHRNKIVVFNRDGDAIFSDSTRSLGNSVEDACDAILQSEVSRRPGAAQGSASRPRADNGGANGLVEMAFTSNPQGALVTIYGAPIGRTPFITKLQPGTYKAIFSEEGFYDLTQEVAVGPGHSNIVNAAFETKQ